MLVLKHQHFKSSPVGKYTLVQCALHLNICVKKHITLKMLFLSLLFLCLCSFINFPTINSLPCGKLTGIFGPFQDGRDLIALLRLADSIASCCVDS